jgi:hypothetical protein
MKKTFVFLIIFLAGHYLGDIAVHAGVAAYNKIAVEVQACIPD